MKDKQLIAFFPVPLDEELLSKLSSLSGQILKDLSSDMAVALKNRVHVFAKASSG
jgi:hypothetical protein